MTHVVSFFSPSVKTSIPTFVDYLLDPCMLPRYFQAMTSFFSPHICPVVPNLYPCIIKQVLYLLQIISCSNYYYKQRLNRFSQWSSKHYTDNWFHRVSFHVVHRSTKSGSQSYYIISNYIQDKSYSEITSRSLSIWFHPRPSKTRDIIII